MLRARRRRTSRSSTWRTRRSSTIVVKEAYDVHRELLELEGSGVRAGTRAVIEGGAGTWDDERFSGTRPSGPTTRSPHGLRSCVSRGGGPDRRADRRLPGAARGSSGQGPRRGTSRDASRARTTSRVLPCGLGRRVRASPRAICPPGLQIAGSGRRRRARPAAAPLHYSRGSAREDRGQQLDADRGATSSRDDRIVLPLGSVEQHGYLSLACRRHSLGARCRRGRRAARSPRPARSLSYSRDALLRRLPRQSDAQGGDLPGVFLHDLRLDPLLPPRFSSGSCS